MRRFVPALAFVMLLVVSIGAYAGGARHATAEIRDSAGNVRGFADFTEDAAGRVHVSVHVQGLTPGQHGLHLHAVGACAPDFAAAGGHFNPGAHQHGLANPAGPHAGDLPNLEVNPAGVGRLNAAVERVTLSAGPLSLFDLDGSAIVIHAAPDDQLTQPIGGSGARIACGVIEPK
jgi:Cu-Zn family superoxide dismutase